MKNWFCRILVGWFKVVPFAPGNCCTRFYCKGQGELSAISRYFVSALSVLLYVSAAWGQGEGLLDGEIRLEQTEQLLQPSRMPSLREIVNQVNRADVRALAVWRLHSSADNHYAPAWSAGGSGLAFLRSDLELGTRKVVMQKMLSPATTIYSGRTSFEDLSVWSSGHREVLVFESNNEPSGNQNVHQASFHGDAHSVTKGNGVIDFPAMHTTATENLLTFRRDRELFLARYAVGQNDALQIESLGEGEEAQVSPTRPHLAVVRRSESGGDYRLVLRPLRGSNEKVLHQSENQIIRNPRFSPDGRFLAFHVRGIQQQEWSLWMVHADGSMPAQSLVSNIRVQEDFRHVGPAWGPRSAGIWYFANRQTQGHYALLHVNVSTGESIELEYPAEITSGSEVAVHPDAGRPILVFAGHIDKPRDIFAVLLSRTP